MSLLCPAPVCQVPVQDWNITQGKGRAAWSARPFSSSFPRARLVFQPRNPASWFGNDCVSPPPHLVWIYSGFCLNMVWIWSGNEVNMVWIWLRFGWKMVWKWPKRCIFVLENKSLAYV